MEKRGNKFSVKTLVVLIVTVLFVSCSDYKQYYANGAIEEDCEQQSENKWFCKYYYETGELKAEYYAVDGKTDGFALGYYKGGSIDFMTEFRAGKRHGRSILFYENGNIKTVITAADDEKNGTSVEFYENGNVKEICTYVNSKKTGWAKVFIQSQNQMIKELRFYRNDTLREATTYDTLTGKSIGIMKYVRGD